MPSLTRGSEIPYQSSTAKWNRYYYNYPTIAQLILWQRHRSSKPLGSYLGNMGHVGEAVGQLLMGMDGIHSSWLGEAALRGLGRRSRW